MKGQAWTEWEDSILRQHYETLGVKGCKTLLKDQRTEKGIKRRASILRLRCDRKVWTGEKLEMLRTWYPKVGARGCQEFFPNHSYQAIRTAASFQGLTYRRRRKEKDDDVPSLNENKSSSYCALLTQSIDMNLPAKRRLELNIRLMMARLDTCSDPDIHRRGRWTIANLETQLEAEAA